jgi:hypothetical protein
MGGIELEDQTILCCTVHSRAENNDDVLSPVAFFQTAWCRFLLEELTCLWDQDTQAAVYWCAT